MNNDVLLIGRHVQKLDTPALIVDLDALERNISKTAKILKDAGVGWRPHIKSQKIPAIAHMEIAAGAIGVTCAKLGEAEVMVYSGIKSVLIANQIVGPQKIARLVNLCKHAEVIVAVDSAENVLELDAAGLKKGVQIPVVVEVDTGMNRCGVEPGEPAILLSRQVHECSGLRYAGLMTWESPALRYVDPVERRTVCEELVGLLTSTAQRCQDEGLPVDIVSCGGTGVEEISSRVPGVTEIQAGGIIFNAVKYSSLGLDREFALKVLSMVISRPNPTRIVTDAGYKTMSTERGVAMPEELSDVKSVNLSAEHGKIELEKENLDLSVGDKLMWIPGSCDATIYLHDEIYGVRDEKVEVVWPILARGKLR